MWTPGSRDLSSSERSAGRVLMTADGVGGVWQYATDLASALGDRGVEVTLAVMGPPLDASQHAEASRRGITLLESACKLEWMDDPWDDVARSGEWLLSLEATLRPDVVHLNGYCHARLDWRAPTIIVAHSCVRSWWRAVRGEAAPSSWERYSEAVASGLRAARLVVAPTEAMRSALDQEYGRCGQVCVIPNGRQPAATRDDLISHKSELILAAGRVWDDAKNIASLCDIAPRLRWPVYVAGDAGQSGADRLMRDVCYLGRLPSGVLAEWYERAAIYALPARYEPFGLSVLEAAASGCALVLGDIPSLRENWSDAALFVEPGDGAALQAAIESLIDDPERRERLGRRASGRAAGFTLARTADRYVAAYDSVLNRAAVAHAGSLTRRHAAAGHWVTASDEHGTTQSAAHTTSQEE
jgi:glycogen(starch) synthase